jgi:hypothetical protein
MILRREKKAAEDFRGSEAIWKPSGLVVREPRWVSRLESVRRERLPGLLPGFFLSHGAIERQNVNFDVLE